MAASPLLYGIRRAAFFHVRPAAIGTVAIGALAAWLVWPVLFSTHVEGFTALIQLDAIAADAGLIGRADLLYPVQTEYFYVTRQGVVLLLRGLMALGLADGDVAFRVATVLCFVAFVAGAAIVVRRRSALGWPALAGAVLVIPGLSELGFYFNDGVVSTGFGMLGLAALPLPAVPGRDGRWLLRGVLCGAALGMAALARTDGLLLLPLAAGLAWLDGHRPARLLLLAGTVACGMAASLLAAYAVSGTTLLQAVQIGLVFDGLHGGARSKTVQASVFLLFFGLAGLVLTAAGAALGLRRGSVRERLVFLALPVPFLVLGLRGSTELRQVYPLLAPWFILHCGRGLEWVWLSLGGKAAASWAGRAIAAGLALAWLVPPVFVPVRDGPRAVLGRMWSPPLWDAWQRRVSASLADVERLLAAAATVPRLVVISAHFNTDHFLQLRAWQGGWRPLRADESADGCGGAVQAWRNAGHELLQVRTENPYGIAKLRFEQFIALQLDRALSCPAVVGGAPVYTSDFTPPLSLAPLSEGLRDAMPAEPAARLYFGWPRAVAEPIERWMERTEKLRTFIPMSYGVGRTAPLSAGQVLRARTEAAAIVAADAGLPSFESYAGQFHARFWQPDGGMP